MAEKKVQAVGSLDQRRKLIEEVQRPSIREQCELLNISRAGYYYQPQSESEENLGLLRLDKLHLKYPTYGSRRLMVMLEREGQRVNRKRLVRLMKLMGMEALFPRRHLSQPGPGHEIYPYLLKEVNVSGPDQVWCADITYVPMAYGFMYLVAVMDWWSRYVLAWELSNTLEAEFCIRAWERALAHGRRAPVVANADQGSQFTSPGYIDAVESAGVEVSMDGVGRWIDNRFIERLWWSTKYEDVYLNDYGDGLAAGRGLTHWFKHYNTERPHQSLDNATPADWYWSPESYGGQPATWEVMKAPRSGLTEHLVDPAIGTRQQTTPADF